MSIYNIYLHTIHIFCMCFLVVRRMKRNVLCDFPGLGFHGGRLRELRVASRQISLRRAPAPRRTREFRVGLARLHQPKPWRRPWDLNGAELNSSNSFHSLINSLLNSYQLIHIILYQFIILQSSNLTVHVGYCHGSLDRSSLWFEFPRCHLQQLHSEACGTAGEPHGITIDLYQGFL